MLYRHCIAVLFSLAVLSGCVSEQEERNRDIQQPEIDYAIYNKQDMPKAATPAEAVRQLEEGNARFVHKEPRVQQAAKGALQATQPFAAIVNCCAFDWDADAIFDQPEQSLLCVDVSKGVSWKTICQQLEQRYQSGQLKLVVILAEEQCEHKQAVKADFTALKDIPAEQYALQQEQALRNTSPLLATAEKNRQCRITSAIFNQKTGRVRFLE